MWWGWRKKSDGGTQSTSSFLPCSHSWHLHDARLNWNWIKANFNQIPFCQHHHHRATGQPWDCVASRDIAFTRTSLQCHHQDFKLFTEREQNILPRQQWVGWTKERQGEDNRDGHGWGEDSIRWSDAALRLRNRRTLPPQFRCYITICYTPDGEQYEVRNSRQCRLHSVKVPEADLLLSAHHSSRAMVHIAPTSLDISHIHVCLFPICYFNLIFTLRAFRQVCVDLRDMMISCRGTSYILSSSSMLLATTLA